jgi:tRNA-Thr(GGU) m(6)t(6)A37 methyltransferase TsaA
VVTASFELHQIGRVESPLVDLASAPLQGDEGAPVATIRFDTSVGEALKDLRVGDDVIVLTWLDRARRDVLAVHPRGDERIPLSGVFSTRSPDRPNPIGLHPVTVLAIDGPLVRVANLEAIDGTPVIDVKPALGPIADR